MKWELWVFGHFVIIRSLLKELANLQNWLGFVKSLDSSWNNGAFAAHFHSITFLFTLKQSVIISKSWQKSAAHAYRWCREAHWKCLLTLNFQPFKTFPVNEQPQSAYEFVFGVAEVFRAPQEKSEKLQSWRDRYSHNRRSCQEELMQFLSSLFSVSRALQLFLCLAWAKYQMTDVSVPAAQRGRVCDSCSCIWSCWWWWGYILYNAHEYLSQAQITLSLPERLVLSLKK